MAFKNASLLLLIILGLMPISAALALTAPAFETHDMRSESGNSFVINGADPYILFSAISDEEQPKYIVLNLRLDVTAIEQKDIPMELFFRAPSDSTDQFDPLYRLRFTVPSSVLKREQPTIALALPDAQKFSLRNPMRLDIDSCAQCRFEMISPPKLTAQLQANINEIEPYRVFNGLRPLPAKGLELNIEGWQLKDLTRLDEQYEITGDDPYMISPPLDAATSDFAGVHLALTTSERNMRSHDFQLFYSTEAHGFIERASTSVRVSSDDSGDVQFVIPLQFLGSEHPRTMMLERLRLDFPPEQPGTAWQLRKATLLHQDQIDEFRELIPERRLEVKRQRANGWSIIGKSLSKITSDLGFTLFYLLLLLATSLGFWRAYRK